MKWTIWPSQTRRNSRFGRLLCPGCGFFLSIVSNMHHTQSRPFYAVQSLRCRRCNHSPYIRQLFKTSHKWKITRWKRNEWFTPEDKRQMRLL